MTSLMPAVSQNLGFQLCIHHVGVSASEWCHDRYLEQQRLPKTSKCLRCAWFVSSLVSVTLHLHLASLFFLCLCPCLCIFTRLFLYSDVCLFDQELLTETVCDWGHR